LSSVIQNGPSCQDSPAQEWICQNGTIGRNHRVVDDEVIYSVNIATSKVLQINLEISVYKGKLYIFLKKSNWAEEEGGGASGDPVAATFYSTATKTTPRLYFNLPCRLTKRNKEKKCA
jgi:hypothetical protein